MKLLIITQRVDTQDQLLGFFIDWIRKFSEKFEKVTVLCLEKGEFSLPENVEVISLGKDRGYPKIGQLSTFYFLLSTLKYDAVFVHMNPIWVILGGISWRFMNKKIFFWYTSGGVTTKLKLAEKIADVIFTASKESFRLPSKKVIVTGHGIDAELFRPNSKFDPPAGWTGIRNSKLRILSVGRISPVKNYETLVDAAKILKDKGIDFQVTMVGEAPLDSDTRYLTSLKLKVKSLKLEDNFDFVGKVSHKNLPEYYQSHNIFIHLSKTGSLDKTILEAMACGMKVLSSSDSARFFLPSESLFNESNSSELADKIFVMKDRLVDPILREFVIREHNLDALIEKISRVINQ